MQYISYNYKSKLHTAQYNKEFSLRLFKLYMYNFILKHTIESIDIRKCHDYRKHN